MFEMFILWILYAFGFFAIIYAIGYSIDLARRGNNEGGVIFWIILNFVFLAVYIYLGFGLNYHYLN